MAGHDQSPGRMKSIFHSSKLIKDSGDIFVHDCNREVEDIYCNRFLGKENLKLEIEAPRRITEALSDNKRVKGDSCPYFELWGRTKSTD